MFDGLGSTGVGCMTEEEKKLYDVIANWWDEIFTEPTKGRSACIIDLVRDIMDLKYNKMTKEEIKNFSQSSVDHYQVAYKCNFDTDPQEYRTQKHDTMRMALAAANFLDARGQYTIISVTPIYK